MIHAEARQPEKPVDGIAAHVELLGYYFLRWTVLRIATI